MNQHKPISKALDPGDLIIASQKLYDAVKSFMDRYLVTGNAEATIEDLQNFSAALTLAEGDMPVAEECVLSDGTIPGVTSV